MYTVGILTTNVLLYKDITKNDTFKFRYNEFKKNGLKLVSVHLDDYIHQKGQFTKYIVWDNELSKNILVQEDISPDLILSRTSKGIESYYSLLTKNFNIIPHRSLASIASNKFETYLSFKDFQPYTILLEDFYKENYDENELSNNLVLKPIFGLGGKGIERVTIRNLVDRKSQLEGLGRVMLIQNFIDSSEGYPNLTDGIHDIRLYLVGDAISYILLREAKKGEFRCNTSAGSTYKELPADSVPKDLLNTSRSIASSLSGSSDSIYSLDFCYSSGRWFLIEINASPGMFFSKIPQEEEKQYIRDVATFIANKLQ